MATKVKTVIVLKSILRPIVRPLRRIVQFLSLYKDILACRKNYTRDIRRCAEKYARGEKIRVLFLVSEAAKWKTQSLYDLMELSDKFEPLVAISCHGKWWDHHEYKKQFDDSVRYFSKKGMRFSIVADFKNNQSIDLLQFSPDIVFYDQPYDWIRKYMPCEVSKYALTCYVPYFVPFCYEHPKYYSLPLHRTLWCFFQLNNNMAQRQLELAKPSFIAGKIVATGHPFLDYYCLHREERERHKQPCAIYAPHWAFDHPGNLNTTNLSTFLYNGRAILAFAKAHPEIKWIFKPHPGLEWRLVNSGAWTQEEVDEYYQEWASIAECCRDSDYLDLFARSTALITDCESFLLEYPPCGGALVHLISPTRKVPMHPVDEMIYDSFYKVHNLTEMMETFQHVLLNGEDPKREHRLKVFHEVLSFDECAAQKIVDYLSNQFSSGLQC